ncbi:MAG: sensor histidine kinase [Herminiimonas sp.]|nr:sensor histidine kinase [Herminiimonas sp.]
MLRSIPFSSRNVALLYGAVSVILLALFATFLWYAWNNTIERGRIELLQADAQRMTDFYVRKGSAQLAAVIDARVGNDLNTTRQILLLTDPSMVRQGGNLPAWPPEISKSTGVQNKLIHVNGRQFRVEVFYHALPGGYHLLVGRDIARFEKLEMLFLYGLSAIGAAVLLVAVIGGFLIRRAILLKTHIISRTTSAIVDGDLSRRLPALDSEDEVLARTVNRMLDQIEHLVHSVRNVSNAIAHDLRTPLAELRFRLEELSVTRPAPEEAFAEIDAVLGDVDRIIAIFNALLRLAEINRGTRRSGFTQVNVTKVAGDAAEFYQPVAERKGITLTFESARDMLAHGDPLLLAQAVSNLIDNALKYAKRNVTVSFEARKRPDQTIEVVVTDDGPGIPDEEKSKVVEPFYRCDASRSTPGVGLGLSLVDAVARLHGGSLDFGDNYPGLRASMILLSNGIEILSMPVSPSAETASAAP